MNSKGLPRAPLKCAVLACQSNGALRELWQITDINGYFLSLKRSVLT